ncbi:MAG: dienelactone hydrolase family protein [Planctomycetes bacterium]|nr:dienelactone hydrolase family protein [Planctomycetota bacterium]
MIPTLFVTLACAVPGTDPVDWPALVQKPHAGLPVPDLGLRSLLLSRDGEKLTTRQGWQKARQGLRQAWLGYLGPSPEKPAQLDVRVEQTEKPDGYTRQLLSFASEGEDRLRAYLLLPGGVRPGERRPAVVVFHQTTRETLNEPVGLGKNPELALALHLTRRGYVTLSPECYILKDSKGWAAGQAAALARRRPGWTGMGKMTFDASRCVDLLESLPAVDRDRIGCIGFSLGAKEVLYAMAFEPRYKVGVFNEGGIGLRMSNWTDAWYLTAKMKEHIPAAEHHQVLALVAPRPFLVLGGGSADGPASWPFVKAALPVYELYGARDRIGLFDHKGKHSFPRDGRRIAYRWLDHWLGHTPRQAESEE